MKEIQSELARLKKGIDEAKANLSKLEGREEEILRQLKTEHNLSSIEAAKKEVEKLKKQIATKEADIRKLFDTLKKDYEW